MKLFAHVLAVIPVYLYVKAYDSPFSSFYSSRILWLSIAMIPLSSATRFIISPTSLLHHYPSSHVLLGSYLGLQLITPAQDESSVCSCAGFLRDWPPFLSIRGKKTLSLSPNNGHVDVDRHYNGTPAFTPNWTVVDIFQNTEADGTNLQDGWEVSLM